MWARQLRLLVLPLLVLPFSLVQAEELTRDQPPTVKIGDSLETVKAAYGVKFGVEMDPKSNKKKIHLPEKGFWFFFDEADTLKSMRLEAPFSGSIEGVSIGESMASMKATRGGPVKDPWTIPNVDVIPYLYNSLKTGQGVRYDIDKKDEKVKAIFIITMTPPAPSPLPARVPSPTLIDSKPLPMPTAATFGKPEDILGLTSYYIVVAGNEVGLRNAMVDVIKKKLPILTLASSVMSKTIVLHFHAIKDQPANILDIALMPRPGEKSLIHSYRTDVREKPEEQVEDAAKEFVKFYKKVNGL